MAAIRTSVLHTQTQTTRLWSYKVLVKLQNSALILFSCKPSANGRQDIMVMGQKVHDRKVEDKIGGMRLSGAEPSDRSIACKCHRNSDATLLRFNPLFMKAVRK